MLWVLLQLCCERGNYEQAVHFMEQVAVALEAGDATALTLDEIHIVLDFIRLMHRGNLTASIRVLRALRAMCDLGSEYAIYQAQSSSFGGSFSLCCIAEATAVVLAELGDHHQSLLEIKRAHNLAVEIVGQAHVYTAKVAVTAAAVHVSFGEIAEAEQILKGVKQQLKDSAAPETAWLATTMARVRFEQNRFEEALTLLQGSVKLLQSAGRANSPHVASCWYRIGLVHLQRADLPAAKHALEQMSSLQLRAVGKLPTVWTVESLYALALLSAMAVDFTQSALLIDEALVLFNEVAGPFATSVPKSQLLMLAAHVLPTLSGPICNTACLCLCIVALCHRNLSSMVHGDRVVAIFVALAHSADRAGYRYVLCV